MTELRLPARPRVVLLRSDSPHHRYLESALAATGLLVGVLVEPGAAQRRRLSGRAWRWRVYQDARQRLTGRSRFARRYFASPAAVVPRVEVGWVSSPAAREWVARMAPDLAVVCGTSYIAAPVLAGVPVAVNVHGGLLPWYKGNHGVFFAYADGDHVHIGASLHLVTPELDGGDVLAVVRPSARPGDHDGHLYCRAVRGAIDALVTLLTDLAAGRTVHSAPQPLQGRTYRHRDRTPALELRTWWRRRTGRLEVRNREEDTRERIDTHWFP